MSRHKLVKNLDLEDELYDFDGGENEADAEDFTELDGEDPGGVLLPRDYRELNNLAEQVRMGTIHVREALLAGSKEVTDKQIQEALWYYYYDIGKSVSYLTKKYMSKARKTQAGDGNAPQGYVPTSRSSRPLSYAQFFKDTSWLNVPAERQAVFTPPILLKRGLLGGSSHEAPKMSKLQALAAARRKKAKEQNLGSGSEIESPVSSPSLNAPTTQSAPLRNQMAFAVRNRDESTFQSEYLEASPAACSSAPSPAPQGIPQVDQAIPSEFASTIIGHIRPSSCNLPTNEPFSLPCMSSANMPVANPFAGPSPDDVVIAAQSKATRKGGKNLPKMNGEKKVDHITTKVEALEINENTRAVSKTLDVLAEFERSKAKNTANFVVIGHVDAGKSTLMGRLLYDLNVVDQRTLDRYKKEAEKLGKASFALAWVLDQGTEERDRGVTMDIATNQFETTKTAFTILDAPGHRDFIPNMIAGTSQADLAVLVVDASIGSFESGLRGQTREHALLARSMGVQRMIIAVNKLDTVNWSKDRFDEISQQTSAFLLSAGFQERNLSFVPCSGLNGDNITRKSVETLASWYTGATLVEELDDSEPTARAITKPLRLTVDNVFRGGVQNPLSISGRLEAGSFQKGDPLLAQPSNQKCFVKALEVGSDTKEWAVAGQNVTIHLTDIDSVHLKVGDVLCSPSNPIKNIEQFTAKLLAFEFLTPMQVDLHRGRLRVPGKIKEIVAVLDKGTGAPISQKKPRIVKPAQVARVIVELEAAVPLEAPGRVVLRSDGETVAAGLLE